MCATCWAQGLMYVGGAVGGLRIAAARAGRRRIASAVDDPGRETTDPNEATDEADPTNPAREPIATGSPPG